MYIHVRCVLLRILLVLFYNVVSITCKSIIYTCSYVHTLMYIMYMNIVLRIHVLVRYRSPTNI